MGVPFLDLKAQYQSIRNEVLPAVEDVMRNTAFAGGPFVEKFEQGFASFCGAAECVAVGSGTDALWAALVGLGVGPGHEVILPTHTFIATAEAVSFVGATPVLVDIDETSYNIDPARVAEAVTPKTRAIIPVHIYGQPADMDSILELAAGKDIRVLEDAAQAHGAEYKGRRCGSLGDVAEFSFYPGKNLGAYGEGGAATTSDPKIADAMRMFRDHGQSSKYHHDIIGWNCRMDGIQGAVLSVKLKRIEAWTDARIRVADMYDERFGDVEGVIAPKRADNVRHVYHLYVIRVKDRDGLIKALREKGIGAGIHYPVPVHLTKAYRALNKTRGSFPVAEKIADEIVSLPMFPEMTESQVDEVVDAVKDFVEGK